VNTLLIIMNPRYIPKCMAALRSLRGVDKAWCSYFTELQLEQVIPNLIAGTDYDRYMVISDDVVPTQEALDKILELHDQHPTDAACGWVNVDAVSGMSTINPTPLTECLPAAGTYDLMPLEEAEALPLEPLRTYFHGMVFITMTRERWLEFPFQTYRGFASDLHQSWRLQESGVPIWTHPEAYVFHVKERQNKLDKAPGKELLIGVRCSRVIVEQDTTSEVWHG
jgi:hypothetical protein